MGNHSMLQPLSRSEVASAARTTTGQSATLTLPLARTYLWILDVTVASGGNDCTMDVTIQVTPQSPATPVNWYNTSAFKQVAQTAMVDVLRISNDGGPGEAAAEWQAWSSASGGPVAVNLPLTRKYRIAWTMQGAAPSYTFSVWLIAQPRGAVRM